MNRFIREEDVYKLFGQDGTARLHVGDIDVLPRVELRETGGQVECVGADDLVAKMKKLHPYFAINYLGFDALEHDDQIRVEQIARCIAEVTRAPVLIPPSLFAQDGRHLCLMMRSCLCMCVAIAVALSKREMTEIGVPLAVRAWICR